MEVQVANQFEVSLHGVMHHFVRLGEGTRVWNLTAATKLGYLCENGPAVEGKPRQRIVPYLKAEEKGIEFFEINCECFVRWGDYLQILLLYARTSRNADEKARLHEQLLAIRRTLRDFTGAFPIEQPENDDSPSAVFKGVANSEELERRYEQAKSGKNGVFFRRKNGEEYVLVRVPKLTPVSKRSKPLTRCKWYCYYVLPYFCAIFGDNFLALLKEYLVHTVGGKELLVDVIVQMKQEHQVATARRPVRDGGDGGSDTESASDEEEDSSTDSDEDDGEEARVRPPSLSRQLAMTASAARREVKQKKKKKTKASTRIPRELLLALEWREHGRFAFEPAVFLKALHNARVSLGKYKDFFQELGSPRTLPGPEMVKRWHAVKAKFLVEHTGIEFKATPECTGVLKFDGLFQMVIKVILDKGGTFEETPDGKRIMLFRCSWDKRKIKWGQCAYQLVPLHDCFRTQHWEDVLPLLIWNGEDDSVEDIQKFGQEIIDLNKKIANDQMELVVRDHVYIIRLVSSPDMKALRGGITEEITTAEDFQVAQLQDFHYFVQSILIARTDGQEHKTHQDLCAQDVEVLPFKQVFPTLIAEHKLTDRELRCYKAPESHKLFCPFCRCAAHNISNSVRDPFNPWWKRRRQFQHAWAIHWSQWAYCEFHCLERITETLLGRTHKDIEVARSWSIQFFLKLNKRMVKDYCSKLNVDVDLLDRDGKEIQISGVKLVMASTAELENPEYEKASFGMIPYKSASLIRRLHAIWIPLLNQHMQAHGFPLNNPFISKAEEQAWAAFDEFWRTIEADGATVSAWKQADPTFRPQVLILQKFALEYEACYGKTRSHYMHVAVCHTAEMWERFGTLLRLSNQSTEATNYYHDILADLISTHGGLFSTVAKDVIVHRLSSLLFAVHSDMDRFSDRINREYCHWLEQTKNPANPRGPRTRPSLPASANSATAEESDAMDVVPEPASPIRPPLLDEDHWPPSSTYSGSMSPLRMDSPAPALEVASMMEEALAPALEAATRLAALCSPPRAPIVVTPSRLPTTSSSTTTSPALPPRRLPQLLLSSPPQLPPPSLSTPPLKLPSLLRTPSSSASQSSASSSPVTLSPQLTFSPLSFVTSPPNRPPQEMTLKRSRPIEGTTKAQAQQQFVFHNHGPGLNFKPAPRPLSVRTNPSPQNSTNTNNNTNHNGR